MTLQVDCYVCGGDCSHAYGTWCGYPCHIGCIPSKGTPPPDSDEDDYRRDPCNWPENIR